jgi:hypothetical protein
LQYWGRSNIHRHWFAIGLRFGQKFFNLAFCSYLHLRFFNWAAVPGGSFSNPPTSQSPIVGCYAITTLDIQKPLQKSTFMTEYWNIINQNKKVILGSVLGLFVTLTLLYFFTSFTSTTIQKGTLEVLTFQQKPLNITDLDLKYAISLIVIQLYLILVWVVLLKIYSQTLKQYISFLIFLIGTYLLSIYLSHIIYPYVENYLASFNIDGSIANQKLSITYFFDIELTVWVLLNSFCLPIYFVLADKSKNVISSNSFLIIVGFILFFAGMSTPSPDFISQLMVGLFILIAWLGGHLISKLLQSEAVDIQKSRHRNIYFVLSGLFLLVATSIVELKNLSIVEFIAIISVLILVQHLIVIRGIFRTDKISGTLALLIPFYSPYYILKNIKTKFGDRIFYKVFSVLLIFLNLLSIYTFLT